MSHKRHKANPSHSRSLNRRSMLLATAAGSSGFFGGAKAHGRTLVNEEIQIGFISCGGRAGQHMKVFDSLDGVRVAALCDPDEGRMAEKGKRFPKAKRFVDLRDLIDDKEIDAVVVATCNHWHCLASIWAMEAGKDVYVEKPLSHSQWEGEQTVKAARRYNRICQVGTQQRSDPMQAEIKQFLHQERGLGKILSCRVNRFGVRGPIGRRSSPLQIDSNVNYDLWLGPAQDEPIYRDRLQYDWHWDFNTGSGEMGNWGVHVLDDARNNVFLDQVALPSRIMGGGGRVAWDDAGETPNVHFVYFDTGEIPTVIGLTNLPKGPGKKGSPAHPGPGSGYIAYCEGGRFEGRRGRGAAYDSDGKLIREFRGNSGGKMHQQNFIDCVRSRQVEDLNTDVEMGNLSTGWCNLANIAFQVGGRYDGEAARSLAKDVSEWGSLVNEMEEHLAAYNLELSDTQIKMSSMLEFDPKSGQFTGEQASEANAFLKREYRAPYAVPEISETA